MKSDKPRVLGSHKHKWQPAIYAILLLSVFFCGCPGPNSSNELHLPGSAIVAGQITIETNRKLSSSPHLFDVYRATNADKAIIFLHGATGSKHYFAYQLGLIQSSVEGDYSGVNEQLLLDNKILAVFPQGQAVAAAPESYTWSNYVTTSGQNDVQFVRDLLGYISARYNVARFYIVGHSSGGMMTNRLWCEASELFEGFVSIAGPPSAHFLTTPCSPSQAKPYLGIVGSDDVVLQVTGNWDAAVWTLNQLLIFPGQGVVLDPDLIGERYFLPSRVEKKCGESVGPGDSNAVTQGAAATWSFCSDSVKLVRIESARHTIASLESTSGKNMLDFVLDFTSGTEFLDRNTSTQGEIFR